MRWPRHGLHPTRTCAPAHVVTAVALALTLAVGPASSEQAPTRNPAEPAQLLILGTYHFANPGLDVVQVEVADILAPQKQSEVAAVVDALAAFRPTRIAVEVRASGAARLDSLYAEYRAGAHTLSRNEVQQLGFRLAERFGHDRVHAVDHGGDFPFEALMTYVQEHDPAMAAWIEEQLAVIGAQATREQREHTVAEMLRRRNDPTDIAAGHALYLTLGGIGAGDGYVGADLLAGWYERNIRIFADLRALATPGERVLVIFGSGHLPILRELVLGDSTMRLVEPNDFLPARQEEP